MQALWFLLFFAFLAVTLLAAGFGFRALESRRRSSAARISQAATPDREIARVQILANAEPAPTGSRAGLYRLRLFRSWQEYIYTGGLQWRLEALLGAMAVSALIGALLGLRFHVLIFPDLSSAALAIVMGVLPLVYVKQKRKRRLDSFEKQFPEALDFIARSVLAGHAFSVSLELLANESVEPLRTEFRKIFQELNLGSEFSTAMTNLVKRVPLVDVRFFVSAVLLQKETGGNLSEMLTKLAYVIRERFRIKGQVRSASAHGRITATILTLMPFVLAFGLSVVSPDYLPSMANDPTGKKLILAAIVAQGLGYYFLHRIINIEV